MLYLLQKRGKVVIIMARTREEITKRIETVKNNMFYLNMKDRWTTQDYRQMNEWHREVRTLEAELENF